MSPGVPGGLFRRAGLSFLRSGEAISPGELPFDREPGSSGGLFPGESTSEQPAFPAEDMHSLRANSPASPGLGEFHSLVGLITFSAQFVSFSPETHLDET